MISISSISSLENEKKKLIEELSKDEIEVYLENLTKNLYCAFDDSDVEGMVKYQNLISEANMILSKKNWILDDFIISKDRQIANQYLVNYKTRLELINIVGNIKELLESYSRLSENFILLKNLIQYLRLNYLEFSVHNEVDVVESIFSNDNVQLLHFNRMINDLKCRIESEIVELKHLSTNFNEVNVDSLISNYEEAYRDINSKYEILKDSGLLEEIGLANQLLKMVLIFNQNIKIDSFIEEVEEYITSNNVLKDSNNINYNLKEVYVSIGNL